MSTITKNISELIAARLMYFLDLLFLLGALACALMAGIFSMGVYMFLAMLVSGIAFQIFLYRKKGEIVFDTNGIKITTKNQEVNFSWNQIDSIVYFDVLYFVILHQYTIAIYVLEENEVKDIEMLKIFKPRMGQIRASKKEFDKIQEMFLKNKSNIDS